MKGTILNTTENDILIRCSEGNKFSALVKDIKSSDVKPKVGDDVDFEVEDGKAVEVYILRTASAFENIAQTAAEKAASSISLVKSHMTEENKEKVRHLAANASETVQKIGGELKGKAGDIISNVKAGGLPAAINTTALKQLHNKFSVFALAMLFIFSFVNVFELEKYVSASYYSMVESSVFAFMLVACAIVAGLGLHVWIYRILLGATLVVILKPFHELYTAASDAMSVAKDFGVDMGGSALDGVFSEITNGFVWFFILGLVLTLVTLVPGVYKAKQQQITTQNLNDVHP